MFNLRLWIVLILGFSSGLPLALSGSTLQAWMKTESVDLKTIGVFSLVGLPYTWKFVWAPVMDRFVPSWGRTTLGRRRGWMIVSQLGIVAVLLALSWSSPRDNLTIIACLAVALAFFSASQDIAIDAYRVDVLHPGEFGQGASLAVLGYRLGMLLSGAVALMLSDHLSWSAVYQIMAASVVVGLVTATLAPATDVDLSIPKTMQAAVVEPFKDFFSRPLAFEVLIFTILYKLGVVFTLALQTPYFMDLGFSRSQIGEVVKAFGMIAAIGASLLGMKLLKDISLYSALLIFGIAQTLSALGFGMMTWIGPSYGLLIIAVGVENFTSGLGNAALGTFIMRLCNKKFSATQFALLTSLDAIPRVAFVSSSGLIVETIGWGTYYVFCVGVGIPALLMLSRFQRWQVGHST